MTRRQIAIFSDIHGNDVALHAVLHDIDASGINEVYCLGDLVGYGPAPSAVIEMIRDRRIPTIRGNYDDGIGHRSGGCGCYYASDEAKANGDESYAFTDEALDDADHRWLAELPDSIRFEHEGARILLAHGSPRKINEYLLPDRTDAQLIRLASQAEADVVCVGHVHMPYHRVMQAEDGLNVHYISSGSVGKPKDGDPRACWVEVVLAPADSPAARAAVIGSTDVTVSTTIHRVDYDIEAVARAIASAGLPVAFGTSLRMGA